MAATSKPKNLELNVTNLGPIARANIDLRPMTVFVGPSNTGKSYLAILIYALHRFFGGRVMRPHFRSVFRASSIFGIRRRLKDAEAIPAEDTEALISWADDVSKRVLETNPPEKFLAQLPESVAKIVRRRLEDMREFDRLLDGEIARCFGVEETRNLIRNGARDGMSAAVRRPVPEAGADARFVEYRYTRRGGRLDLAASVPSATPLRMAGTEGSLSHMSRQAAFYSNLSDAERAEMGSSLSSMVLSELTGECGHDLVDPLTHTPYYLPADRTGVIHAHRVVVSSLIGHAPRAGLDPEPPLPVLSGVLADFLETLIGLRERRPTRPSREEDLAEMLETNLLSGEILNRESATGYPEFSYRPDGWGKGLPLMYTSSMVSELAPVVLYLRHVVRPEDVLIIEEPESHLHPAKQVEFIRHLSAVVRAGVRVVITTHSEWVLEELANLVRLSSLPKSRRQGVGGASYALDPKQLGVWLFEPKTRPRGSVVKEIPFNEDFGGFRSGFDEVAMETYNDYAAISNRIGEARSEYKPRQQG